MINEDLLEQIDVYIKTLKNSKKYSDVDIQDTLVYFFKINFEEKQLNIFAKKKGNRHNFPKMAYYLSELFYTEIKKRNVIYKTTSPYHCAMLLTNLYDKIKDWEKIKFFILYSQNPENCKDKFMPIVRSVSEFCQKYENLVNHYERNKSNKISIPFKQEKKRIKIYYDTINKEFKEYNEERTACPFNPCIDVELFKLMSDEDKRKYFDIKSDEEIKKEQANIGKILNNLKQNLISQ